MSKFILGSTLILTLAALCTAFVSDVHDDRRSDQRKIIQTATRSAEQAADMFLATCNSARPGDSTKKIREALEMARREYKACEFLVEYLDPGMVTSYLNGAPLPKLDPKSTFIDVLEPEGLQVLDEVVYAQTTLDTESARLLQDLSGRFANSMHQAMSLARNAPWTDRMMFESMRSGILRLTSLGITGFDRPASEQRLEDNIPFLNTFRALIVTYRPWCESRNAASVIDSVIIRIEDAQSRMKLAFDSLDRAELIRGCLDPLYSSIVHIQHILSVEFADEAGIGQIVLNPRATSMFSDDVFIATATAGLSPKLYSPALVHLGRTLFFDPILSVNNQRSCASCHRPDAAFTDSRVTSMALGGRKSIQRNAPTLINSVFARRFFYDLRAQRINDVVAHVVTHEDEFGFSLLEMVNRLRTSPEYVTMFETAFGSRGESVIDASNVGLAIGAYISTLRSFNSRVDRYLRGESVSLTTSERSGMNLFMGRAACGTCHFAPTFSGYVPPGFVESESEILGVPAAVDTINAKPDSDIGRAGGIRRENSHIYRHSFKTPTVRNSALTAPYFHNGAYGSLEQVIDFYARGGGRGIGWAVPNQTLPFDSLELSRQDRSDLIAFINALTDTAGLGTKPSRLPVFRGPLNARTIGGEY
jgi:cytochrome c peroxidase